jgi:hypothetical protein
MRSSEWRLAAIGLAVVCASQLAAGQSNQEWIAIKQKCGIPAGTAYNDWVAAGSKCNSGSTAGGGGSGSAEQLGTTLGNVTGDLMLKGVHNLLHGTARRLPPVPDPERQLREVAAQQLNNSGVYLLQCGPSHYAEPSHACKVRDCAGAIIEFQKALQQTPNDTTILSNLQYARRLLKAEQTRDLLGKQWGDETPPYDWSKFPYGPISPNVFNQVNLDPNVVDFRGKSGNSLPGTTSSYLPAGNANALNAILTGSDPGVVDLSHAGTSVDPHALQTQIDGMFGKHGPHSDPPDPMVGGQQAEIKKLLQPSSEPDAPPQK